MEKYYPKPHENAIVFINFFWGANGATPIDEGAMNYGKWNSRFQSDSTNGRVPEAMPGNDPNALANHH